MPRNLVVDEIDRLKAALHAAHARREELWKRAERAGSELAAVQADLTAARRGPVVEWRKFLEYERASCGAFRLVVHGGGWYLTAEGRDRSATVDSGEETGPEGKDKCEAAYRRAAGL